MELELIQPWSVPVVKTTLSSKVLQTMVEISDQALKEENLKIDLDILKQREVKNFFIDAVCQFVITCKCQMLPHMIEEITQETWMIQILSMWVVSHLPGEYAPTHMHTQCQVSGVMYVKMPKIVSSDKQHLGQGYGPSNSDGSIQFVNNVSGNVNDLCTPCIKIYPQIGDFLIFGSHQLHSVYPYYCEEEQEDIERRSIAFNANFISKTDYEIQHGRL